MSEAMRNTSHALNGRGTHFSWDEFDRLPRLIRDLMNYTPMNDDRGFVYRQIMDGSDVMAVARAAHRRWSGYARAQTHALYGPTHPQVQSDAA